MTKTILANVIMNLILVVVFVFQSNQVLNKGLEETQVFLVLIYGFIVIFANALFVGKFCRH